MSESALTLAMIVKNEEVFLEDCLKSVEGVVDEMIVVDTGSTDKTIAIARRFGAQVIEIEWPDDFAQARNVGLDLVKTPWTLIMDADEELVGADRDTLRDALEHPFADAYNVRIISLMDRAEDITESYVTRVVRSDPELRFSGAIHEQLFPALVASRMNLAQLDVRLTHKGYLGTVMQHRNKTERNRLLLEEQIAREPHDIYMLWQLAQTYNGMGRTEDAVKVARRAMKLVPIDNPLWVLCAMTYARALAGANQPKKAVRILREGQLAFPNYTDFWYLEGMIQTNLQQWPRAEACFNQCLSIGEAKGFLSTDTGIGGFKSLYRIAQCHMTQGRPKEAVAHLLLAIKQQPQYRSAWRAIFQVLAGSSIVDVLTTITLGLPQESLITTLSSFPNRDDNENNLLREAEAATTAKAPLETETINLAH